MLQIGARFLLGHMTQPIKSSVIFVMVRPDEGGLGFCAHSSQGGGSISALRDLSSLEIFGMFFLAMV